MRSLTASSLLVLAGALLCSSGLPAQSSNTVPRITSQVDESSLTPLKGNVPRLARAEFDQGEADAATQLTHMRLVLSRSATQQAALDSYLAQLQDKSSPNYHKWLTPQQFGQLYGPADSDITAIVAWLQSHGFTVEPLSPGRTNIAFSGSVNQVEAAFHTAIHSFVINDGEGGEQQFYSNTTDPQIPSALAGVVMGVAQMDTIRPRPHSAHGSAGKLNPETKRIEPTGAATPSLTLGSGTTNNPYLLFIVPADAATIYDSPNPYNANYSGTGCGASVGCTGTGVKIGIGGAATISATIAQAYRSTFLGSAYNNTAPILNYCTSATSCSSTTSIPVCSGTPNNGCYDNADDAGEAYLDNELSGGMAPGATIYYYASTDLYTGIEAAIEGNINGITPDIFSLSFGDCEADMGGNGSGTNAWFNNLWSVAAAAGIAVTVSTGDSGSAGCDDPMKGKNNNPDATGGLAVSGFASTPYNIAVGGTDFYSLVNSFSTYVSQSEGSAASNYRTVLANGPHSGYIPESTWNASTYNNTTFSQNEPISDAGAPYTTSENNIWAGSGGKSAVYPKPSWQRGTGVPSDGARDLPDVSLMAGSGWFYAMWLVCDDAYPCSSLSENGVDGYGGTSTAAPTFAGILAMVQQSVAQNTGCTGTSCRLGQAAQTLYDLYNGSHANSIFHDQSKVGNNSVPCTSAPDGSCVKDSLGYSYESGYNTNSSGYDQATGLGSVDATQLVNYWSSSTGSTSSFAVNQPAPVASPATIAPGASSTANVTVSSTNGYVGTVTLTCALTSPTSLTDPPSCSVTSGSPMTLSSSKTSGIATVTVYTTAASAALVYPKLPGKSRELFGAGSGALLALLLFFGIPARRRSWRSMLGILVLIAALGSLSACGSGSTSTGPSGNSGTAASSYTFTVTGTGNTTGNPIQTTTFTVAVN